MTSPLVVPSRSAPDGEPVVAVSPESAGWEYVGFEVRRLAAGQKISLDATGRELCIVVLAGRVDVTSGSVQFDGVGERPDVFSGPPAAVYSPPGEPLVVVAADVAEIAVASSPADRAGAPDAYLVSPSEIDVEVRGSGSTERRIHPILMGDRPAQRLRVVEVLTPGGNWSSFPPHKHDVDNYPQETLLEETYYHRVSPPQGFAVQRVYTDDRELDETITVTDGDVVLVPRGYHPVGAVPGYDLYYLNVMAGPVRSWVFVNDPDHEWLAK